MELQQREKETRRETYLGRQRQCRLVQGSEAFEIDLEHNRLTFNSDSCIKNSWSHFRSSLTLCGIRQVCGPDSVFSEAHVVISWRLLREKVQAMQRSMDWQAGVPAMAINVVL